MRNKDYTLCCITFSSQKQNIEQEESLLLRITHDTLESRMEVVYCRASGCWSRMEEVFHSWENHHDTSCNSEKSVDEGIFWKGKNTVFFVFTCTKDDKYSMIFIKTNAVKTDTKKTRVVARLKKNILNTMLFSMGVISSLKIEVSKLFILLLLL